MRLTLHLFSLLVTLLLVTHLHATHNRAGEITYVQLDELTIRATITTYTRTSSFAADRDSLQIFWGDGQSTWLQRVNNNGFGEELANDIKKNEYVGEHTYPTRGNYKLSTVDPNRIAGILNIDFPNSVNIQFYLETTFTLLDPRFQGANNSAELLQPPIDFACIGQPFIHNPNAFDRDGDSLSYELITPFQEEGLEVPNYQLPDSIRPGDDNRIFLNAVTGDFIWQFPPITGEFNITYLIKEHRNGVVINTIIRDMQILVRACPDENRPPDLEVPEEICVVAGELIEFDVIGTDRDTGEQLVITALGGPFEVEQSPATFETDPIALPNSMANGKIRWQTVCDHVSEEAYQIVFKITDELTKPMSGLATLKTIRIKVVAPPPLNLDAEKINDVVTISWDNPYTCDNANTWQGFSVWRKEGSTDLEIDTCNAGLEGSGYEKLVFLISEEEAGRYFAQDVELERGKIYCYRVVAEFAQLTTSGNLFNRTASIPSEEICIRSTGEEPLITQVTVDETSATAGEIKVRWLLPDATLFDTTELVGPYGIEVYESSGFSGENFGSMPIESFASIPFGGLNETRITSNGLMTSTDPYSYAIDFTSGTGTEQFRARSSVASSVFLSVRGADERVELSWEESVPWNNYNYLIYQIDNSGNRTEIGESTSPSFTLEGLENGEEYCFLVESYGRYGLRDVPEPIVNLSNESCGVPRDDRAPCTPIVTVSSVCDNVAGIVEDQLINTVEWTTCDDEDLSGYRIFYRPNDVGEKTLLAEVSVVADFFEHVLDDNIAGCYSVRAFDSSGNESEEVASICVDNCPNFTLPNAFTPNNDMANDLFKPRTNLFIDRIEFQVYNRWGQKVWETTDPEINWDGRNFNGTELAEGTYSYICRVFEKRVTGIEESQDVLQGYIQLLR